ncbi:MAG: hypothetical protein M3024_05710, partial [Candidatus Dormibacteraeota bacterium]|nr:hypothetical protein [Candidatus Dormibacteraeota bacterium]
MSNEDPRLADTWAGLVRTMEASRGVVEAMLPLAAGLTRDQLAALLKRAGAARGSEELQPIEQVWALMGLVPRHRYDELKRRYDTLRARLEEAEASIQELRRMLDQKGKEAEARQKLDSWGSALQET